MTKKVENQQVCISWGLPWIGALTVGEIVYLKNSAPNYFKVGAEDSTFTLQKENSQLSAIVILGREGDGKGGEFMPIGWTLLLMALSFGAGCLLTWYLLKRKVV